VIDTNVRIRRFGSWFDIRLPIRCFSLIPHPHY